MVSEELISCDEAQCSVIHSQEALSWREKLHIYNIIISSTDTVEDCTTFFQLAEEKHDLFLYRNQILTFSLLDRCSTWVLKVILVFDF